MGNYCRTTESSALKIVSTCRSSTVLSEGSGRWFGPEQANLVRFQENRIR